MERRTILGCSRTSAKIFDLGESVKAAKEAGMTVEQYERQMIDLNPQLNIIIKVEQVMTHEVIYDIIEDGFTTIGIIEQVRSVEEAQKLRKGLIANPICYNIQINEIVTEE